MISRRLLWSAALILFASLNWGAVSTRASRPAVLPITGGAVEVAPSPVASPTLDTFVATVKNGRPSQVVGVYAPGVLVLRVVQQPPDEPAYVARKRGFATQFGLAAGYGTIGLLAHNDRSGALFFSLSPGQEVDMVYGDGAIRRYSVSTLRHFQALRPTDPYSDFVDFDLGGAQLSSTELFQTIYTGGDVVVFQTCIKAGGHLSWGRLFVIATPIR